MQRKALKIWASALIALGLFPRVSLFADTTSEFSADSSACTQLVSNLNVALQNPDAIPGKYLVRFRSQAIQFAQQRGLAPSVSAKADAEKQMIRYVASDRSDRSRYIEIANTHLVESKNTQVFSEQHLLQTLGTQGCAQVESIEPDVRVYAHKTPKDLISFLWGLQNTGQEGGLKDTDINLPEALDLLPSDASEVVVGVVDSGSDYTHPDLKNMMWVNPFDPSNGKDDDGNGYADDVHGINLACEMGFFGSCWEYEGDKNDPMDLNGHGTHVAGTIAAQSDNGIGITGVTPRAKIMALRFLTSEGSGANSDALSVMDYALQMRRRGVNIRVLNNSWGSATACSANSATAVAIANLKNAGILFVAAAGNDSLDLDKAGNNHSPSQCPGAFSIASVNRFGKLSEFSNYGKLAVPVAAPGEDIRSTWSRNSWPFYLYYSISGTSMATPHASGVAALLFSAKPSLTPDEVIAIMTQSVKPIAGLKDKVTTAGMLDAAAALKLALAK